MEKTLVCSGLFFNGSAHYMKLYNYSEIYLGGEYTYVRKLA
jgi:hypothetical protein